MGREEQTGAAAHPLPLPDPPLLLITDRHAARYPLTRVVDETLAGGVRWVLLREKDLSRDAYAELLHKVREIADRHGALLATSGRVELAAEHGVRAVHLPSTDAGLSFRSPSEARSADARMPTDEELWPAIQAIAKARSALGPRSLIGVSCHGPHDLRVVTAAGADYATLSPIFPTTSKPTDGPLQGIPGLQRATSAIPIPILALGGLRADRVAVCRRAGGAGVAVVGALMGAIHPRLAAASMVEAWRAAAPTGES